MEVKEFSNQIIQQLKAWKTSNLRYIVGVDVGATNVRVAVKKTDSNEPYLLLTKFQSKSITTLLKGLLHVENQIKEILGVFPVSASLGLAGFENLFFFFLKKNFFYLRKMKIMI